MQILFNSLIKNSIDFSLLIKSRMSIGAWCVSFTNVSQSPVSVRLRPKRGEGVGHVKSNMNTS